MPESPIRPAPVPTDPGPPDASGDWPPTAPDGDPTATTPASPTRPASGGAAEEARAVASEARQQAAGVATTARDETQHTAEVAAEKARETVGAAREQVRGLYDHTVAVVTEQAAIQQRGLVGALTSVAIELTDLAEGRPGDGPATAIVQDVSRHARRAADWLDARTPDDVLAEVTGFARRHPGQFLAIAASLGVAVGRLARGMKDTDSGTAGTGRAAPDPVLGEVPPPVLTPGADEGGAVSEPLGAPLEPTPGVVPPAGPEGALPGGIPARRYT